MPASDDDIRRELLEYLRYQRSSVRSIVEGLDEEAWHTPAVASGWTVAGMVEHLGNVERHWFLEVVAGSEADLAWDEGRPPYDPQMAFTCDRPSSAVLGYYRDQSDEILAGVSLSDAPRGRHGEEEITNVRVVILHVIEETAAHSGHLEIARELWTARPAEASANPAIPPATPACRALRSSPATERAGWIVCGHGTHRQPVS